MNTDIRVEKNLETPYDAGYDAGYYGAAVRNCHFGWFGTKERMKEWERGNKDGSDQRELDSFKNKKARNKLNPKSKL